MITPIFYTLNGKEQLKQVLVSQPEHFCCENTNIMSVNTG